MPVQQNEEGTVVSLKVTQGTEFKIMTDFEFLEERKQEEKNEKEEESKKEEEFDDRTKEDKQENLLKRILELKP